MLELGGGGYVNWKIFYVSLSYIYFFFLIRRSRFLFIIHEIYIGLV